MRYLHVGATPETRLGEAQHFQKLKKNAFKNILTILFFLQIQKNIGALLFKNKKIIQSIGRLTTILFYKYFPITDKRKMKLYNNFRLFFGNCAYQILY